MFETTLSEIISLVVFSLGVSLTVVAALFTLQQALKVLSKRTITIGSKQIHVELGQIGKAISDLKVELHELREHPKVLVAYSRRGRSFAKRLAADLREGGATVWLGEEQIKVGDSIRKRIWDALEDSQWTIMVLSDDFHQSNWVSQELHMALKSERSRERRFVLPVLLEGGQIPDGLVGRYYADFSGDYGHGLATLLHSMHPEQGPTKEEQGLKRAEEAEKWITELRNSPKKSEEGQHNE